jgi:hypothetical protein
VNYAELVAAVSDYTENTFPTTQMNVFIKQAEQRIYNSVQIANLRKNVVGITATNNKYLACPDDFLSSYSIAVISPTTGAYTFLLNKDVNFIREAYPIPTSTGSPKYYAIFGPTISGPTVTTELSFILGPTPDAAYSVELHYYYYPESIVSASTTWLGDNFDSALFNGTMLEAITYMKGEPDMVKLYGDRYVQSISLLKNLGDGKQRMDAYRDGQVRVAVS